MAHKMSRYDILYLFYLFTGVFSISDSSINFSIDYFEAVRVKYICLLNCGNGNWPHKFLKHISLKNIAASSVKIDKKINSRTDLDVCLHNKIVPIGILIDPKCPKFEDAMIYASRSELLDSKHKWLIIEENIIESDIDTVVEDDDSTAIIEADTSDNVEMSSAILLLKLNLSVNADVTVAITKDLLNYKFYEVFNFGKVRDGKFIIQSLGDWNVKTGLNITKTFKYYRRWDYRQMALRIIVAISPIPEVFDPEMLLGRIPGPGVPIIEQTSTQVLNEIAGVHNFRFDWTVVDRWVGDYNRNHTYTATTALYYGETDITPLLRMLPAHFDRYDVLYPPTTYIDTRYFYKIPNHGIGNLENQFLTPLSPGSWLGVVVIAVFCGIVLLFSAIVEERKISVDFAIFSVLALICQQFFEEFEDIRRISSARKLTTLVTGLACLLIYNYYTSSVVSWLLNGPPPSINSLWELLDSSLQPVFEEVGFVISWLYLPDYYFNKKNTEAEDELKRRLLNLQSQGITVLKPINEGIEMVKKGGYVYHAEMNAAYSKISRAFTQKELCDLGSLPSMEKSLLYSCVPKNSPYKEFFIWSLSRFLERGVINCIQLRTRPQVVKCEGSTPRALALGGAAPAFILLAAGFFLGTFIMFLERLKWKHDMVKRRRGLFSKY